MNTIRLVPLLLIISTGMAFAIDPDECEIQRAAYPKDWNDVSKYKSLFTCSSRYSGSIAIMIGPADNADRRLMSLVPLKGHAPNVAQDSSKEVYRIWLDREQAGRLVEGKYFATIVRQKGSCWVRGDLYSGKGSGEQAKRDSVFLMDNVETASDNPGRAGSFYNKAPRFSVFQGDAYYCNATK